MQTVLMSYSRLKPTRTKQTEFVNWLYLAQNRAPSVGFTLHGMCVSLSKLVTTPKLELPHQSLH